jgi:8-oxo-dGTP diphosphatase
LKEENLEYRGLLKFLFVSEPEKSWDCSIFFADYDGEVRESDEMAPQWFALDDIPYNTMREDDKIWLPELLN